MNSEMFDFNFDPLIVGDTSTLGFIEELMEEQVNDAIDYIVKEYGYELTKSQIESVFELYDIEYNILPDWLKLKFDIFEIIGE